MTKLLTYIAISGDLAAGGMGNTASTLELTKREGAKLMKLMALNDPIHDALVVYLDAAAVFSKARAAAMSAAEDAFDAAAESYTAADGMQKLRHIQMKVLNDKREELVNSLWNAVGQNKYVFRSGWALA